MAALGGCCARLAGAGQSAPRCGGCPGAARRHAWRLPSDALNRTAAMTRSHEATLTPDHRRILTAIESSVAVKTKQSFDQAGNRGLCEDVDLPGPLVLG